MPRSIESFASQAVIAIENTRLLNELRQRTDDLTESLEQQTATSEVLRVISSSPGHLTPVFNAILEKAMRLCDAAFGILWSYQGERFHAAALVGVPPAFAKFLAAPIPLVDSAALGDIARSRSYVHVTDLAASESHRENPVRRATVDLGGARTGLAVPIVKNDAVLGIFVIYRQEVRPFTEKQISLITNFAAQAVIAIENARLLNELRQRTDDLTESLEQQTATSKVLEVISRSAFDLRAVFETVAESSVRLCGADRAFIFRFDGELLRMAVAYNSPPEFASWVEQHPIRPGRHSGSARAALERRTIHIPDVRVDPEYTYGAKDAEAIRTVLGVPILKGDDLLGVMMIYHLEGVRPFTEKQVALVETFADQAAIAIENARLFEAEQQRTRELSESLEQQTATSEVLKVISSSPAALEPVFNAMLENATRICEAKVGTLFLCDADDFRAVAVHGESHYADWYRRDPVARTRDQPHLPLTRSVRTKQVIHIPDLRQDQSYIDGHERIISLVETAGAKTHLVVPMLKEREPIGVIAIYRQEVRPFTDKQIELVQNFAAQAVIAIENARLLNELPGVARSANRHGRRAARHLQLDRRPAAGVRRHAGERNPAMRGRLRHAVASRRGRSNARRGAAWRLAGRLSQNMGRRHGIPSQAFGGLGARHEQPKTGSNRRPQGRHVIS